MSFFDSSVFVNWVPLMFWLAKAVGFVALVVLAFVSWAAVKTWTEERRYRGAPWAERAWYAVSWGIVILLVTWTLAWFYTAIDSQDNPNKYRKPAEAPVVRPS